MSVLDITYKPSSFPLSLATSNSVICDLGRALQIAEEILKRRGLQMPSHFTLQCDNTCRESRNSITFKFASWLTSHSIYRTVDLLYYRVGHTHCELDQRFSVCGSHLARKENLETLNDSCSRHASGQVHAVRGPIM